MNIKEYKEYKEREELERLLKEQAERAYAESDFGRSIATSTSGVIGLTTYLLTDDWVLAVFGLIISFSIFRLIAISLNASAKQADKRKHDRQLN